MGHIVKSLQIRFGDFNDDWEQRKLEEVTDEFQSGKFIAAADIEETGEYPVYGGNGLRGYCNTYNHDGDFALIGRQGALCGNMNFSCGKAYFTEHAVAVKANTSSNTRFLYYLLDKMNLGQYSDQSAQPGLAVGKLIKLENMFPSKAEQDMIGEFFLSLDNLITLHQRKVGKFVLMKQSMLQKMFPKEGEKTPEFRFEGFSDDWEQRKLEDVVEFLDTLRKPLEGAKRVSGPYPYYGASGIVDYVDGYIFDEELILLSEDGANITDRNYPVCFLASGKYWVNNHAHVLKCKDGNENNFICNSLERKDYKQYNSGMAMPKLNQEVCRGIPVSCPNYAEQKKIGDYFRNLDNLITLHQRKVEKLKNIKRALLEKMFV
ncbi:MAG: restriction endonuclease subunit S [Lachnospiraceae bacterium]|nr:restriction endonuclease subunit S [Lachnospiraceae bacterium]